MGHMLTEHGEQKAMIEAIIEAKLTAILKSTGYTLPASRGGTRSWIERKRPGSEEARSIKRVLMKAPRKDSVLGELLDYTQELAAVMHPMAWIVHELPQIEICVAHRGELADDLNEVLVANSDRLVSDMVKL